MMTLRSSAEEITCSPGATAPAVSTAPLIPSSRKLARPDRRSEVIFSVCRSLKNRSRRATLRGATIVCQAVQAAPATVGLEGGEPGGLFFENAHGWGPRNAPPQRAPPARRRAGTQRGDPPRRTGAGRQGHHQDRRDA